MTHDITITEAMQQFKQAAMRHSDAMLTCLDAFRSQPRDGLGVNWTWSDRACKVFIREGGFDAWQAATGHINDEIAAMEEKPNDISMHLMVHREIYRQKGGIRANMMAVNAFIKSAEKTVKGRAGAGWKRERREANRALREVTRAWFELLQHMSLMDALDAQRLVYRAVGDEAGFATAEFTNALGVTDLINASILREAIKEGQELPPHAVVALGHMVMKFGTQSVDWAPPELAERAISAAVEWGNDLLERPAR